MGSYRITIGLALAVAWGTAVLADGLSGAPALRESYDPRLQSGLEATLGELGLDQAVTRRKLCVALVDITDPSEPRVAEVNGDHMMYAASLPKIGILLGAFVEIERSRLALDRATHESLTRMVRVSSNEDATKMLNRIGKYRVNQILRSDRFRLYDPLVNGGLWVGKEYAKGPAFQRDPLHNISHGATAMQAARFYYLLETGQLVGPTLSVIMKEMLSKPEIEHKFVKGLEYRENARIYRKSGTWHQWHADSAIVEAGGYKYIMVALAEDSHGGRWLTNMAAPLHDLIVPTRVAAIH
jgi:beta-lactamase class A